MALIGILFALAVPRLRLFWASVAIGGTLAIAGVAWSCIDPTEEKVASGFHVVLVYGYGMYLTLAGSIVAVLAALVGLVMLGVFRKGR